MPTTKYINLVKHRKPPVLDIFLSWALTIGRGLVILTEIIALGAFLFRFSLDRQLIDLHDKIVQQQNIVSFLKSNENTYRNLQTRLSLANNIMAQDTKFIQVYHDFSSLAPAGMTTTAFIYTLDTIHIESIVQSVGILNTYVDALRNYPGVEGVSLDKIENKTSEGIIDVAISVTFKKGVVSTL